MSAVPTSRRCGIETLSGDVVVCEIGNQSCTCPSSSVENGTAQRTIKIIVHIATGEGPEDIGSIDIGVGYAFEEATLSTINPDKLILANGAGFED